MTLASWLTSPLPDAAVEIAPERVSAAVAAAPQKNRQRTVLWAAAALAAIALASGVVWYLQPAAPLQVMRLNMDVSPADALAEFG